MDLVSRESAKKLGLKRYFDAVKCVNGHICERIVSNYRCSVCHKNAKRLSKNKRYAENPDRFRANGRLDYQRHSDRYKTHSLIRSSRLAQATPSFVTRELLKPFVEERNRLNKETGIRHDIDHIYPLKPKDQSYCGLNVPANLQVISASENRSKQNRWFGSRYSRK